MAQEVDPRAKEVILIAINKARRWVDELLAGGTLAKIAQEEGCTARHARNVVQLAFVSPRRVKAIMDDIVPQSLTATELQQFMSPVWSVQERQHLK